MGTYSETLMEHFLSPRNSGAMESPDLVGRAGTPGLGPFLILYLRLDRDRIGQARYQTYGCGPAIASGSVLTEMITGRTPSECLQLDHQDLIAALGGVPPDKLHCPALAIAALREALKVQVNRSEIGSL
jgi:NifU-like protein involved in Fe-S cluster formation